MIKAFQVTVVSDRDLHVFPGIEHEGKLWFAPKWRTSSDKKTQYLDLLVRFDNLQHKESPRSGAAMYVMTFPVPGAVLEGGAAEGYETLVVPGLKVPRATTQARFLERAGD